MSYCGIQMRETLLDKLLSPDSASICFKGGDVEQKLLEWLKAHPEVQPLPTEDGIAVAGRDLYSCP
jgi:hypothetical protein